MTELGSYKAESRRTGLWILLVALGYNLVGSFGVQAADFYVNKTADSNDIFCFPGPPEPPPFNCSLREAIMKANILAGKDTIHVPAGRYTLTQTGRDEDASVTGDLDITDDVEIIGAGALSRLGPFTWIDAAYIDRVFHVHGDVSLDLRGVRIVQGDPGENRDGGGILNVGGRVFVWSSLIRDNRGRTLGGGIEGNGGLVVVADSHIQGNFAEHRGGGIEMRFGSLIVVRSAIDLN